MKTLGLFICLTLTACNGARPGDPRRPVGASSEPSRPAARPSSQPGGGPASPAGRDPSAPETIATAKDPETKQPSTAALDRRCIHKGDITELQGLTVSTKPGATVGYSTSYSDSSNELTNRNYITGFGTGPAGPDGVFRATWVVPAQAPTGAATVHMIATSPIPGEIGFTIVPPTTTCS